jgi:hypothetical protein
VSTASLPSADRAAWLAARRTGIGASEVAAVLGLSPYESPLDVYCRKLGLVPEKAETEAMRWGLRLEPLLAAEYAERTGYPLVATQVFLRHPDKPFLLATLDGVRASRPRRPGPPMPGCSRPSIPSRSGWSPAMSMSSIWWMSTNGWGRRSGRRSNSGTG